MKNHNTSLLIILFKLYEWYIVPYYVKSHFFVIASVYQRLSALFFDKYPFKMHLCFISLTFISIHYQR